MKRGNPPTLSTHVHLMKKALKEAHKAYLADEVPVGALLYHQPSETLLFKAHNQSEKLKNPLKHAEMIVIHQALDTYPPFFLENCILYVTLEPCPLCASAILMCRIPYLVFAAYNPKGGAITHGSRLYDTHKNGSRPEIISGICESESSALLTRFFKEKRLKRQSNSLRNHS